MADSEPDSVRALREALADSDIANAYGVAHPGRVIRASRALLDALPGLLAEAEERGVDRGVAIAACTKTHWGPVDESKDVW